MYKLCKENIIKKKLNNIFSTYIATNKKVYFLGWERLIENVHIVEGLIC